MEGGQGIRQAATDPVAIRSLTTALPALPQPVVAFYTASYCVLPRPTAASVRSDLLRVVRSHGASLLLRVSSIVSGSKLARPCER